MNPYVWNEVRADLCYGRDTLLKELFNGLTGNPRYSFGLAGGRRMGKSTTLRRVEQEIKIHIDKWLADGLRVIPIYVDSLALPRPLTGADVWSNILKELQSALPDSQLTCENSPDFAVFKDIVQPVLSKIPEHPRIIVMIDEIEPIAENEWAHGFLANWRALLTNTPGLSEYFTAVFSGARQLAILQRDIGSPLKDILEWRSLRCLEFKYACDLMQEPISRKWPDSFLEQVYKETGGHPFLLQYIMHQVANVSDKDAVESVTKAVDKFVRERGWQLFEWWNHYCTPTARQIYIRLPSDGSTLPRLELTNEFGIEGASEALEILQHVGLVAAEDDDFAFCYRGEIFRRWYRDSIEQSSKKHMTQPNVFIGYSHKKDQLDTKDEKNKMIHILHLSDIHLGTKDETNKYRIQLDANKYRTQLETDLIRNLKIKKLEYLVISGDIGIFSTPDEYEAAFKMIDGLVNRFSLDYNRVIVVPGNHDLNWKLSRKGYNLTYKDDLKGPLQEGRYLSVNGDDAVLLRNEAKYQQRFKNFSEHFYKKLYKKDYPLDYAEQGILHLRPDDRLIFLALNSCWEIDHKFEDRASINMDALSRSLDQLQDSKYDDWLKIAVWHHPVACPDIKNIMKNLEFMEQLAVHGFKICMHGHIHEAIEGYSKYDDHRGINVVGAGTFGAPADDLTTGIPLQYNLLKLDVDNQTITVETRKKEKPDGAWSADARWGDKNDPKPRYIIELK